MENQNNQNDKPADGYAQAPQQEEKSVLAELAEFVSRKKEAAQSVNVDVYKRQDHGWLCRDHRSGCESYP